MDRILMQFPSLVTQLERLVSGTSKPQAPAPRRHSGRPRMLTPVQIKRARHLREFGYTYNELATLFKRTVSNVYYALRKEE